jgi:hypothetical protein
MPHPTSVVMDSEKSKLAAHAIKKRLEELNTSIKLNHAYEALAIAHRYPNWATMKAAIQPSDKADVRDDLVIGWCGNKKDHDTYRVLALSSRELLNHVHCFGTSSRARHEFLKILAHPVIERGATTVFVEPVSSHEMKADILEEVMSLATSNGRRSDFYVLDLSDRESRMGNTCNLIENITDPRDFARLILLDGYKAKMDDSYAIARRFLEHSASQALKRGNLSLDSVISELKALGDRVPKDWHDEFGTSFGTRSIGLADDLCAFIERFSIRYKRFLDPNAAWSGIEQIFRRPQILLVFVPAGQSETEGVVSIVMKALARAVASAPGDGRRPDMILLNDVDFAHLSENFCVEATKGRVSIVMADQCPTPPVAFNGRSVEFRNMFHGSYHTHYVVQDGVESQIRFSKPNS